MFIRSIDENISLFTLQMHHAEECYQLIDANREHLGEWLAWVDHTGGPEDIRSFIEATRRAHAEHGDVTAGISYDGRFAGIIGLSKMNSHKGIAELGYWIGREFQGRGLVTKACSAVLQHAFEDLGLNRVQLQVATSNERSKAVPRRLGFQHEGTHRQVALHRGSRRDLEMHSLLRSEWIDQQKDGI